MLPHLSIFTPLPLASQKLVDMDLNPQITNLEHTTGPGGFERLSVGFRDPQRPGWGFLPQALAVNGMDHAVLEYGGFLCSEGRVLKTPLTGGEIRSFEATGYGITALADGWYDSVSVTPVNAIVFLRDILVRCTASLLALNPNPDLAVDSGIQHTPNDYHGKMGHDLVDMLAKEAGGSTTSGDIVAPFDFGCWESRYCTWVPRLAPLRVEDAPAGTFGPDYRIDFDNDVDWEPDFTQLCSDVTVFYNDSAAGPPPTATSVTKSNAAVTQKYGVVRKMSIQGGTRSASQAAAYAATYLALYSEPRIAVTIHRSAERGLATPLGTERPPQLIRNGEWVQVGDQEPAYILTTRYNWTQRTLEIQGNVYPPGYWQNLAQLEWAARMGQANQNVNTGAPLVAAVLP